MPLHLIGQCCKCKGSISVDLWSIKRNHGYSEERYVCQHFNIDIDHESKTGFFGLGWSNKITVKAKYKPSGESKVIISRTFNRSYMEFQDYKVFANKVVFHARVSDSRNNYPTVGSNYQKDIEYNEKREEERRERERKRREEQQRQLQRECNLKLSKLIEKEKEEEKEEKRKNDLKLAEKKYKRNKKTTFRRHRHIIDLDVDGIFDLERRRQICKSDR